MATRVTEYEGPPSLAEVVKKLGGVSLKRIWSHPAPGTATEKDLLAAQRHPRGKLLELVDGVLVEKAVGTRAGYLAGLVFLKIGVFLQQHKIGRVLPGDSSLRLIPGLVRVPDVSFISKVQIPGGKFPRDAIASLYPDLAVEVLSRSNTRGEMQRKLKDLFLSGTRLVWVIDPKPETAKVYRAPDVAQDVGKTGTLDGEDILPGFSIKLDELFAEADEAFPPD